MKGKKLYSRVEGNDRVLTIRNRRRLDILNAGEVKKSILKSVKKGYRNIILDLSYVDFIDSTAVAMLMDLNTRLSGSGYTLRITNVSNEVMELIRLVPTLKNLMADPVDNRVTAGYA